MGARESPAARGLRRSRLLRQRLSEEFVAARLAAGLSLREIARRAGVSVDTVIRFEAGDATTMTIDLVARLSALLGLKLVTNLYREGDPVRDKAQLALIRRFRERVHTSIRFRAEVVVPVTGDSRSADGMLDGRDWDALVEAETRVGDLQLVERKARAKQRDLGAKRLILLVSDTPHNREVLRLHPELQERFPVGTRTCLRRLGKGEDPGGDCLVIL